MGYLVISSALCEPPSEVLCFRDVTLYGSDFFDEILVECCGVEKDLILHWLRRFGAMDFVSDLILPGEETGYSVRLAPSDANIQIEDRLWQHNVGAVIKQITR